MPSRFTAGLIIPRLKSFDIDSRRIHHIHDLKAILIPNAAEDAPIPPSIFERCFTCRLLTIRPVSSFRPPKESRGSPTILWIGGLFR